MLENLPDLVDADPVLVRRGRHLDADFLVEAGPDSWLVRIRRGRVEAVERGPFVMPSWRFALRADAESWRRFWAARPAPGDHDLLALARRGRLRIEGDIRAVMANLLYLKGVMEKPRLAGARP